MVIFFINSTSTRQIADLFPAFKCKYHILYTVAKSHIVDPHPFQNTFGLQTRLWFLSLDSLMDLSKSRTETIYLIPIFLFKIRPTFTLLTSAFTKIKTLYTPKNIKWGWLCYIVGTGSGSHHLCLLSWVALAWWNYTKGDYCYAVPFMLIQN